MPELYNVASELFTRSFGRHNYWAEDIQPVGVSGRYLALVRELTSHQAGYVIRFNMFINVYKLSYVYSDEVRKTP